MIEVPEEKEAAVGCGCCGPHAAAAAPAASEPASLPELASPPCSPRSPAYGPTSPGASYSPLPEVEDAEDARQAMVRERKRMAQAIALRHYDIQTSRGERTTRSGALFKKNAARTARGKPVFSVEALIVWWLANPRPLISRDEHPQIEADKRAQDQWYRVRDEFLGDVDEDTAIQLVYDTLSWEAEATKIQDLYLAGHRDEAIAAVPTRMVEDIALVGPKEKVRDDLEEWKESMLTTLLINGDLNTLRTMAELVG